MNPPMSFTDGNPWQLPAQEPFPGLARPPPVPAANDPPPPGQSNTQPTNDEHAWMRAWPGASASSSSLLLFDPNNPSSQLAPGSQQAFDPTNPGFVSSAFNQLDGSPTASTTTTTTFNGGPGQPFSLADSHNQLASCDFPPQRLPPPNPAPLPPPGDQPPYFQRAWAGPEFNPPRPGLNPVHGPQSQSTVAIPGNEFGNRSTLSAVPEGPMAMGRSHTINSMRNLDPRFAHYVQQEPPDPSPAQARFGSFLEETMPELTSGHPGSKVHDLHSSGSPPTVPKQVPGSSSSSFQVLPSGGVVKGATFLSRNVLPHSALGGHAASHPPGLGNRVLRADSSLGSGISMAAANLGYDPTVQGHFGTVGYAGGIASAAATDFTKRKGWPLRVVDELMDFVHVLDPQGKILFASPGVADLTGWHAEELRGQKLVDLVHPGDTDQLLRALEPQAQRPDADIILYFRFRCKPDCSSNKNNNHKPKATPSDNGGDVSSSGMGGNDSSASSSANDGTAHVSAADACASRTSSAVPPPPQPPPQPPHTKRTSGVRSTSSREYGRTTPARIVTDNVQYVVFEFTGHPYFPPAELAEYALQRRKEKDAKATKKNRDRAEVRSKSVIAASDEETNTDTPERGAGGAGGSGVPIDSSSTQVAPVGLPGQKIDGMVSGELQCFFCSCRVHPTSKVSILDSFLELKVENERLRLMLAQLRMDEEANERRVRSRPSPGPEPRDHDRAPEDGNVSDSEGLGANPKKKLKQDEGDYVCADCGRIDSPEWRKGPLGPKTLCNACGLRWAKRIKRKGGDPNTAALAFQQQATISTGTLAPPSSRSFASPAHPPQPPLAPPLPPGAMGGLEPFG